MAMSHIFSKEKYNENILKCCLLIFKFGPVKLNNIHTLKFYLPITLSNA